MRGAPRRSRAAPRSSDDAPAIDSIGVRLDQRVRQQLAGQALDDRAGRGLVGRIDGQFDAPADPDGADAADAEVIEAALDGPALRVEDAGLRRDVDGEPVRAHRAMTSSAR